MREFIPKIVITGGPCGGKSSAMPFLRQRFIAEGFYPVLVPEAPTLLMNIGHFPHGGDAQLRDFQERVIDLILIQEEEAYQHAIHRGHAKPIIICDRGIMDTRAYTGEAMFGEILHSRELHVLEVIDRYQAVFHMQSTAVGAEEHYTTANNSARFETIEEARLADLRTLDAWSSHPRVVVIANDGRGFDAKLDELWSGVFRVLTQSV